MRNDFGKAEQNEQDAINTPLQSRTILLTGPFKLTFVLANVRLHPKTVDSDNI